MKLERKRAKSRRKEIVRCEEGKKSRIIRKENEKIRGTNEGKNVRTIKGTKIEG